MPVFECARCNKLTYSASRLAPPECELCESTRHRELEHAFSFDEAHDEPRELGPGDHACAFFEATDDVVPLCLHVIRRGLAEGARIIAYPQAHLQEALRTALSPEERDAIEWGPSGDVYGPGFDVDEVIAYFRTTAEAEARPVYVLGGSEVPLSDLVTTEGFARYEQLVTDAAVEHGMVMLCLFDVRVQGIPHLDVGHGTHPLATAGGAVKRNERFAFN